MDTHIPTLKARHNALKRYRKADDPELIDAAVDLKYAGSDKYIRRLLAEWPPLTASQRQRLAALLAPSTTDGTAA